ncbi:unnamed protein product [Mycena citricolor]|uniref:Uncharacterized protein n=1 Tax=Mycena citricolor TaxID=2018698 RepID=A0AAD2GTP1_9AGAR|nr:unnamed protein product [Mycena citricolor]
MSPSPSSPHQPAPALPYTGPPPTGQSRPRYADGQYPNLSLIRGSNQSQSHHAFTAYAGHSPPNHATQYPMAGEYDIWGTPATIPTQLVPMPFFAGADTGYGYAVGQEEWATPSHSPPNWGVQPGNAPGAGYPGGFGF